MSEERRSGRTTRLVDEYIQRFFNEPMYTPIVIKDHLVDREEPSRDANIELLKKIEIRLNNEHRSSKWYSSTDANMIPSGYYNWAQKFGSKYFYGDVVFDDSKKSCVIIRTSDPILESRRTQFNIYMDRLLETTANECETTDDKSKKEIIPPSLYNAMLVGRANGYTTRLADQYVQEYFNMKPGEFISVKDHYQGGNEGRANKMLCDIICRRLKEEHGENFYVHRGNIPKIVKVETKQS